MQITITLIIIIITCIVSFTAFQNNKITGDLIFYPPAINKNKQWYRFITCGFIHADFGHLAFNMFSLFLFGKLVEDAFTQIFEDNGKMLYIIFYMTALAASLVPTYSREKDNSNYYSLGASGAVSAVVFAGIFLYPLDKIGLFIIPPIIPGFIFAPIYLFASAWMSKKGGDNINHSAHIWGAIYGVAFLIVMSLTLSNFNPITHFIDEVKSFF